MHNLIATIPEPKYLTFVGCDHAEVPETQNPSLTVAFCSDTIY